MIGREGALILSKYIQHIQVKELYLDKAHIGPKGCHTLIDNLPKTLIYISLSHNSLKKKDKEEIALKLQNLNIEYDI